MVLLSLPLVATLLMGLPLMGGSPSPIPDNHIDHANTISHSYANSHSHSYANSHSHSHSHSMGNSHGHAHSNIHSQSSRHYDNTTGDSLPLLPLSLPTVAFNSSYNKHIPRQLWIAVKDKADELPGHLQAFFARNPEWHVNVCDNACKDAFMRKVFAGTSVLWAYELINPLVGAARADIWRYSVLYTYGGVYLDDDSDIKVPLDQVLHLVDRFGTLLLCALCTSLPVAIVVDTAASNR